MHRARRQCSRSILSPVPAIRIAILVGSFLALSSRGAAAYPERFGVPFTTLEACAAPTEIFGVVMGDWNGDGRPDLAVSCGGTGSKVSTFLGTGAGTFMPREDLTSGFSDPRGLAAGDMQGDGIADIVVTNQPNQVRVILKTGPGSPAILDQTTGQFPYGVAVGDLNHDGKLDVVTSSPFGNRISVHLGNGNGTLGPKTDYVTGNEPYGLALGDVNGDGHLDVAVACASSNSVTIWRGTGTGTFVNRSDLPTNTNRPGDVVLVRLNGDAFLDMVASSAGSSPGISVWLGTGGGAFSGPTLITGATNADIAAGDFNRDGKQDLLVSDGNGTDYGLVYLGDGFGYFSTALRFESGGFPFTTAVGDLNGDTYLDVAISSWKHDVSILLGRGDGTFGVNRETPLNGDLAQRHMALADMTGDLKPDLVMDSKSGSYGWIDVLAGDGAGAFGLAYSSFQWFGPAATSLTVADVDTDGDRDVAVSQVSGLISVYKNLGGTNGFDSPDNMAVPSSPTSITAGDLNHDGKPDLVTGNTSGGAGDVSVLLNSGTGSFSYLNNFSFMNGGGVAAVAVADMDDDRQPDVIVAGEVQFVGLLMGDGTGNLAAGAELIAGDNPRALAVADFNSDGLPDIAVACNGEVSVIRNMGPGTFAATIHYAVTGDHLGIVTGEMNQDGKIDIAVTNKDEGTVTVLRGNGDGTFNAPPALNWGVGLAPSSIAFGGGGGLLNLYAAEPGYVQELLNLGATAPYDPPPTVRAPAIAFVVVGGTLTLDVTAMDLNGDPITSLIADALPGGATFVPNGANTAGTFSWTPGPGAVGTYAVDFQASNLYTGHALTFIQVKPAGTSLTGTLLWTPDAGAAGTYYVCFGASNAQGDTTTTCTSITVTPGPSALAPGQLDRRASGIATAGAAAAPVISAPSSASVVAGHLLALEVSATNATSLTVNTFGLPPGAAATLVVDRRPTVAAPSVIYAAPGSMVSVNVTAADPDGNSVGSLTADLSSFPPGNVPVFTPNGSHTAGTLTWTPTSTENGKNFGVTFSAANALVGAAPTIIQVGIRPSAYYKLNGNPNEESGGAPLAPLAGATAVYATGRLGQGADFDGSAAHAIGLTATTALDFTSGFTAECWVMVRPPVPTGGSIILIARSATQAGSLWPNWRFQVFGFGTLKGLFGFEVEPPSGGAVFVNSLRHIDDGLFHHLAATYDGLTIRLYLDGALEGSVGASGYALGVVGGLFQLGGGSRIVGTSTYLNGVLDEVRVWHVPRSQAEIVASKDTELFTTITAAEAPSPNFEFALAQNHPNPFNPRTELQFEIARESRVILRVFDISGRLIRTLVDARLPAGPHRMAWDGEDSAGRQVASGAYLYRVEAAEFTQTRKMILLR